MKSHLILEKLVVIYLVPVSVELKDSLLCSQNAATGPISNHLKLASHFIFPPMYASILQVVSSLRLSDYDLYIAMLF
jgi:hypothetical protein